MSLSQERNDAILITFSPDGKLLACATRDSDKGFINIWNVVDGSLIQTFSITSASNGQIVFSPDGSILATSTSSDNTIKLWNITEGTTANLGCTQTLH